MAGVNLDEVVGLAVKRARERANLTQAELAERAALVGLPTSQAAIARIEKGRNITVNVVVRLALALDVPPLALLLPSAAQDVSLGTRKTRLLVDGLDLARWYTGVAPLNIKGFDRRQFERSVPDDLATVQDQLRAEGAAEVVMRNGLDQRQIPRAYALSDPLWIHPDDEDEQTIVRARRRKDDGA